MNLEIAEHCLWLLGQLLELGYEATWMKLYEVMGMGFWIETITNTETLLGKRGHDRDDGCHMRTWHGAA